MNKKKNLTTKETFALAIQNHQKNNLQVAENLYKEILKTNPNHFESIFYLGTLLAQTQRFDLAKPLLQKAIQINPNYAGAYNNLGGALAKLRKLKEAIKNYDMAIKIDQKLFIVITADRGLAGAFNSNVIKVAQKKIDEFEGGFKIKTTRTEYRAKSVVLAPGKVPNMLGLENESDYFNKGIHYCTKCDAPFYQGRTTASVGVGNYLLESGLLLSRMASKMYLILRGTKLAGDKDLVAAIENNKNIEIVRQSSVKAISGNSVLQHITIVDSSGAEKVLDVDALFIEMGSKINLDYVKHLVKINTKGEIEIESGGMTSHQAIFAAGDATTIPYKQIIVACGDGSNAGLSAFNYLEKLKGKPGVRADWKKQIGGQVFHY